MLHGVLVQVFQDHISYLPVVTLQKIMVDKFQIVQECYLKLSGCEIQGFFSLLFTCR